MTRKRRWRLEILDVVVDAQCPNEESYMSVDVASNIADSLRESGVRYGSMNLREMADDD